MSSIRLMCQLVGSIHHDCSFYKIKYQVRMWKQATSNGITLSGEGGMKERYKLQ